MAVSSTSVISNNPPTWYYTHCNHPIQFHTFTTTSLEQHTSPVLSTVLDPFASTVAPLEHPAFHDPSKSNSGGGDGGDGILFGVSSNTRYQIINGLERLVEASSLAKKYPLVTKGFTLAVRLGNNIYGGMQFIDWAKRCGVQ